MKHLMLQGAAIALLAAAMAGNASAGPPPEPPIACTEANAGQTYTVQTRGPGPTGPVFVSYQCADEMWTPYMICYAWGCELL